MSLIFLADDFPPARGGIQTYAAELARAVAEAGEEVRVVAGAQPGSEAFDADMPCPVLRVPTAGGYLPAAMNLAAGAEQAAAELEGPLRCLVCTKWSPEGPGAIWAARSLARPFVLLGHGGEFCLAQGQLMKWLVQRVVLRRAALCLANSSYTADLFRRARVPAERIGVIHGGVRPERFQAPPEDIERLRERLGLAGRPVLLTVARLVARKGHAQVLRALPRVLERVPDACYLVVGDGPLARELRELADELKLAENVVFTGPVSDADLAAYYGACDVFVMPSVPVRGELAEGLGLTFLEAAAAGRPSVGTRFGGIPDAIADGETGLLVEPGDEDQLADALTRLLADPDRARRMGEAARERVQAQFTWNTVADLFLQQIRRITLSRSES
ncbi:MAG: glycosyltransferase family 4 protein [Armatimonadetes bacterium]|nr:glycosyltransferase family 4 protein [Armatimonadota bacterium]